MRVVAGAFGGRPLKAPPGRRTRPTADRVREALFSILGPLDGARAADLFAGSGALGIEALSRGAASATFVERDRRAAATIRENLLAIGAQDRATVVARDALRWLASAADGPAYDLVLLDPPYDSAHRLAGPLSERLPAVLAPNAIVVSESDKRNPLNLDLPLDGERAYGDTRIAVHRAG
ncbi:MAG TPA: 16S rRNA (guanine(966)-N(2))-methyltransferase RsmD [Thermoleophilaceae bacterium]|jgi:16S rRNA (guanine(966)-N(2))-methyltransferase RsmD